MLLEQKSAAADALLPDGSVDHGTCRKVAPILARIGDKWSVLIVMTLSQGGKRFSELKREIDGISQRMLTLSLRGLERDGLISRTVTPSIPPRVDYELTDLGHSLCIPVLALGAWAREHIPQIEEAQARFDGTPGCGLMASKRRRTGFQTLTK